MARTASYAPGRLAWPVTAVAIVALAVLALPLVALVVRAPWADLPELLARSSVLEALTLSLGTATVATAACLALGVPLAALLAHAASWITVPRRLLRPPRETCRLVLPPGRSEAF